MNKTFHPNINSHSIPVQSNLHNPTHFSSNIPVQFNYCQASHDAPKFIYSQVSHNVPMTNPHPQAAINSFRKIGPLHLPEHANLPSSRTNSQILYQTQILPPQKSSISFHNPLIRETVIHNNPTFTKFP